MQVHILAEPAWDPQLPASMVPTATYWELLLGSSWVPICLRNLSAHPIEVQSKAIIGKVAPVNQILPVVLPTENLGRVHFWLQEGMDPGGIGPPRPQGVAQSRTRTGQGAATQMGTPICLQWPGPRQNLFDQALNWVNRPDALQGALPMYTPHMYDDVKAHLQEMLDIGTIRKSHSSWARVVILVWKKNMSLRFCIDLRKLNHQTVKDVYLLPCIDETLNSLQGSQWFSLLDLTSGYWQVQMHEESKPLTTFTVGPLGFYEMWLDALQINQHPCMTFQQLMEACLGDLNFNWCVIYLDDIVIFFKRSGQPSWEAGGLVPETGTGWVKAPTIQMWVVLMANYLHWDISFLPKG